MAEFGENLRKVREEKGITQQTLADYLYVTRQAVSRWEGGSRYPDLMTAKKISKFLEVSLDELLYEDDMKSYVEKNAILDDSVSKRIQGVLISLAFMCSVFLSIIYLCNYFIQDMVVMESDSETIKHILLTGILGYGTYTALMDRLNPKIATILSSLYFGTAILTGMYGLLFWKEAGFTSVWLFGATALNVVFLLIAIRFFNSKKMMSPVPFYIMSGIYAMVGILNSFLGLGQEIPIEIYRDVVLINIFSLLGNLLLLVLLCFMAYTLHRKRTILNKTV